MTSDRRPHPGAPPPAPLRRAVDALAPGAGDAEWSALLGGRTNRVWLVEPERRAGPGAGVRARMAPDATARDGGRDGGRGGGEPGPFGPLVVKLCDGAATPLFPNDPAWEMVALRWLDGTGLAPRPLGAVETPIGPAILYRHVAGRRATSTAAVARALARLHRLSPPPGLRRPPSGPRGLRLRLDAVTQALRAPPPALLRLPGPAAAPDVRPAFLHGDPTPGNAVGAVSGAVLIDWQCPALGDPCDDLAILLSPAMRRLDGLEPLTAAERTAALEAYGDPAVTARLDALAPLHHALLAAHCLWRAERGWPGARDAAEAELGALEQARHAPARRRGRGPSPCRARAGVGVAPPWRSA